jgi:hypothetical protein
MKRLFSTLRWTWPVLLVAIVLLLPWACHVTRPKRDLAVVVVDKTVPFRNWREHRSLYWLLEHLRIERPEGSEYDPAIDYLGAVPGPEPGDPPIRTRDLTAAEASVADVLYFADTYGVYEGDLVSGSEMKTALDRTPKIYGGLELAEAEAAAGVPARGGTLIAEFNTFASPTGSAAVDVMEATLGVRWTHWVGRYFPRLEETDEVPPWLRENWEREWDADWEFEGPGYVLLYEDAHVEVLRVGEESGIRGLRIETGRPADPVVADATEVAYSFWFDIVEPRAGTDVLASYRWHLEDSGRERLRARGLPETFPAVCRRLAPGGGVAYYFAGDFIDNPIPSTRMPFAGYTTFKRWFEALRVAPSESEFYWRFYVPLMTRLLEDAVDRRASRGVPSHGSR